MHRKRPAFLTDMGLLMFLAVTASLLGYCQTDERGKTQRRDSRPPFFSLTIPLSLLISLPPLRPSLTTYPRPRRQRRKKYGFRFPHRPTRAGVKGRENSAVREKERRRLTFMAAGGTSSSREFTYSESGLMVAAHIHRQPLLIVRETMAARCTRRVVPS